MENLSNATPPGSQAKMDLMAERLSRGEPLFQDGDLIGYEGCSPGCVKPTRGDLGLDKIPSIENRIDTTHLTGFYDDF